MLAAQVTTQHTPSSCSRQCSDFPTIPVASHIDKTSHKNSEINSGNNSFDLDRATSSSCSVDHNRNRSQSAPAAATGQSARMQLSPTSVSSSVSTFIYPPLTGHCHLVSEVIIDVETSVLAYSQVARTFPQLNLDPDLDIVLSDVFLYSLLF